jgi:hypothetical protein
MPSLGAARETLPADTWQDSIADWMRQSALIVIAAPPGDVTPGLISELRMVGDQHLWWKTLIVTPPVPDAALRSRWQALTSALPGWTPFATPLPADPASVLTLAALDAEWNAVTASRRTEWSYAAALAESLRAVLHVAVPATPGERKRSWKLRSEPQIA